MFDDGVIDAVRQSLGNHVDDGDPAIGAIALEVLSGLASVPERISTMLEDDLLVRSLVYINIRWCIKRKNYPSAVLLNSRVYDSYLYSDFYLPSITFFLLSFRKPRMRSIDLLKPLSAAAYWYYGILERCRGRRQPPQHLRLWAVRLAVEPPLLIRL